MITEPCEVVLFSFFMIFFIIIGGGGMVANLYLLFQVVYKQQCKKCRLPWFPYANEEYEKSDYTRPRHVDVKKPHPADLCGKCLAGHRCN